MNAKPLEIAYTVSSSYSGSTLLSMLLTAQPDIGTVSEFDAGKDIPRKQDFKCSCGVEVRECSFFKGVEAYMRSRGRPFSVVNIHRMLEFHGNPLIHRLLVGRIPYLHGPAIESARDRIVPHVPGYRGLAERFYADNEALMRGILKQTNARVFLDANKDSYRMLLLARRFRVLPIFMYKNGIAGVYSYVKNAKALGIHRTVARACRRWFLEQITICQALARFDGDHFELSYSDLCADVNGTLRELAHYLGINYHEVQDLTAVEHHVIGNRMRLQGLTEVREDEKWKDNFTQADLDEYHRAYEKYIPAIRRLNPGLAARIWH